jgi:hypothetical protein
VTRGATVSTKTGAQGTVAWLLIDAAAGVFTVMVAHNYENRLLWTVVD